MNWDAIGAIGEIVGAAAVFASLLYLARQIKVNALATQSQMEAELGQRGFQAYDPVYEGRNADILFRGYSDPDSLSDADALVFDLLMHRQFGVMAQIVGQIESGVIDPEGDLVVGFRTHYQEALLPYIGARRWLSEYPHAEPVLSRLGLSIDCAN